MNQTFSFTRWSLLVAKHWAENKKRYLLTLVAMAGLLFMWFVFVMLTDDSDPMADGMQQISYYFPLFGIGSFYASQFYKEIHSRTRGINYLLLPASIFEKLLCGLLYSLLIFFVTYTVLFYVIDMLAVATANAFHPSYNGAIVNGVMQRAKVINVFDLDEANVNLAFYLMLIFIAVQSAALLGSAYFSSYHFIKTVIVLCLLLLFVFIFESALMDKLLPLPRGGLTENIHTYRFFTPDNKFWVIKLPQWTGDVAAFLVKYAFPPLFWLVTYHRLKEKEV